MDAATTSWRARRERAEQALATRLARPTPTVWLSGQEAAEYVGVSWPTLRQFILEHSIPHVRLGTRWKIEVAVLDEHLRRLAEVRAGMH
jgi:excisionase family DNA binding protein